MSNIALTKWDQRGLDVAKLISTWSKDPGTKVGAYLSNDITHVPINFGYNGPPHGIDDSIFDLNDRQLKLDITLHAEHNCLLGVTRAQCANATLYVYGLAPCSRCASNIIQLGIRRVVAFGHDIKWQADLELTERLFAICVPSVDFLHLA